MSQTTLPRGVLPANVRGRECRSGAGRTGRLGRTPPEPLGCADSTSRAPPVERRAESSVGARGARAGGLWSWGAEPDAVRGPIKHQPFRYELSGMTVPAHDATIRDDGMVTTAGPGAGSILPAA